MGGRDDATQERWPHLRACGRVVVEIPFAETLAQQNGYFHAAVSAAIADIAGRYAALTTMEARDEMLSRQCVY